MSKLPSDITKLIDARQLEIDQTFKSNLKNQLFKENITMAKAKKQSKLNFGAPVWQNFFKKLNTASGLAVLSLLVVVGGASALISSNQTKQNSERQVEIPANLDGVMAISDIRAKALADVPGGTITGVELENEDGVLLYKVKFSDGSFRLYDAKTGQLVTNLNDGVERDETVPAGFVPGIDIATARSIAQNQRPGKTINKIELETENGVVVYSVRFTDDGRVDVNAKDGSVLRVRGADGARVGGSDDSGDDSGDDNSGSSSDDSDDDSSGRDDDSNDDNSGSGSDDSEDDNSGSDSSGSGGGSDD